VIAGIVIYILQIDLATALNSDDSAEMPWGKKVKCVALMLPEVNNSFLALFQSWMAINQSSCDVRLSLFTCCGNAFEID
jgi:hypothetical protein